MLHDSRKNWHKSICPKSSSKALDHRPLSCRYQTGVDESPTLPRHCLSEPQPQSVDARTRMPAVPSWRLQCVSQGPESASVQSTPTHLVSLSPWVPLRSCLTSPRTLHFSPSPPSLLLRLLSWMSSTCIIYIVLELKSTFSAHCENIQYIPYINIPLQNNTHAEGTTLGLKA